MTSKTSYAILISFMALFAALAANAKEPANRERLEVLSSVGRADYAKKLEAYNIALTKAFTPKAGQAAKAPRVAKAAKGKPLSKGRALASVGQPFAQPLAQAGTEIEHTASSQTKEADGVVTESTVSASASAM